MRALAALLLIAGLIGCDSQAAPDTMPPASAPAETVVTENSRTEEQDVSFVDVLNAYRALNVRLETIAYRLQKENAALCPRQSRHPGFTAHTVTDYPENLRPIARELLPVSDTLSIRTVRGGSPADMAGLRAGDRLLRIDDRGLPSGPTAKAYYEAIKSRNFAPETVTITYMREGTVRETALRPEALCDYPVTVFFSERLNGHTNGEDVMITSGLMRAVPEDVNLAVVVAHEMAHAIAGHMDMDPAKALELDADRMALIMLARAGFDIDQAVDYWQRAPHPHPGQNGSATHPTMGERLNNFRRAQREIDSMRNAGQTLTFDD